MGLAGEWDGVSRGMGWGYLGNGMGLAGEWDGDSWGMGWG